MGDERTPEPPTMREIAEVFDSLHSSLVTTAKDMVLDRQDAWCYGVVVGWWNEDPEWDALPEVAERHGWDAENSARNKRLNDIVKRVQSAAQPPEARGE